MPKPVKRSLTPKQKDILDFVNQYHKRHGFSPSLEEIGKRFKLSALSTVYQHLKALISKGYLKKETSQPRGISPLEQGANTVEIPLLGYIAAGKPLEAIENPESLLVSTDILARSGKHYALKVAGTSMIEEGILDGDTVIVREQKTAENGETVVAIVDGGEATLEKISHDGSGIRP